MILIVTIKGLQKPVPHEDDIRRTFALRFTFDRTCKFAADCPLINVN